MQHELTARADVQVLPAGFKGNVETACQSVRVRNEGPDALTLVVGGQPFPVEAGNSWGFETGQHTITITQVLVMHVPETEGQLVLVERIFLSTDKQ